MEPENNRRPWKTPQITRLFAEGAEGGANSYVDEAGHGLVTIFSSPVPTPGSVS